MRFIAWVSAAFGDLRSVVSTPWSEVLLVTISGLSGMIMGYEREKAEKPAGIRTVMLICLGSTLFTQVSMAPAFGRGEPARIAAQIVTGIGFLGAGVILRDRGTVLGLTTAATIWVAAAIGMLIGAGYAGPGLTLGIVIPLVLWVLGRAEARRAKHRQSEAAAKRV